MVTKNILLSVFFQRYCDAVLLRYVLIRPRVYYFLWFLSLISSRSYVCGAICDSTVTDPRCIFSTVVTVHSSFPLIMTHFVTLIWCILYRWNSNSHVLLGWHRRRPFWYWPWPTNRHRPTSQYFTHLNASLSILVTRWKMDVWVRISTWTQSLSDLLFLWRSDFENLRQKMYYS